MNYTQVFRNFYIEWEVLIKLSKETKPNVWHISKNTTTIKYIESLNDCLFRTYGIRERYLIYLIRDTAEIPYEAYD